MRIKEWKPSDPEEYARLANERERCRKFGDVAEGVVFKESLAGRGGMSFMLMPEADHTKEDIQRAASYLVANRDVVSLYFVRIDARKDA